MLLATAGCPRSSSLGPNATDGTTGITGGTTGDPSPGSTGTRDTDTTGTVDPTGAGFIMDRDGGPIECSQWDQDCPPGEKCMPWADETGNSWNATKCTPIAPDPALPGEPCTVEGNGLSGIDDCAIRSMCWNVDPETMMGVCRAFCTGSEANPTCENPAERCGITSDGILILCHPNCDPLQQDCGVGRACIGIEQSFVCLPDASGKAGGAGDPCEYINACDPGLHCLAAEGVPGCKGVSGCCSPYCSVTHPDLCVPPQECLPWFEEGAAAPGWEDVGVCAIPS